MSLSNFLILFLVTTFNAIEMYKIWKDENELKKKKKITLP